MAVFMVHTFLAAISLLIIPSLSQDTGEHDPNVPLMSHASFYNMTPYMAQSQPLGVREGESLLQQDIEDILQRHNDLRTGVRPQSSDMEYMSWDNELAYMAQVWAERCQFKHGNPPNVSPYTELGQNIWAFEGSRDSPRSGVDATQDWYDEVTDYDYGSNQCSYGKVCGHYTQVAWADSNKIGCGRAFCPYISYLQNAWFVVCNYAPAGNYQGQHPYRLGEPCSQCASGIGECYNGLCRLCSDHNEECECAQKCQNCGRLNTQECSCLCPDGWWGADCSRRCVDTHEWCNANPGWPDERACVWASYIPLECPLMCGLCKGGDSTATCDPTTSDTLCNIKFSAFVFIENKLYAFEGTQVWRFRANGRMVSDPVGEKARKYFKQLPKSPTGAFALADGRVGFVKGKKLHLYSGKTPVSGYPKTLTSLNLPKNPKASFHRTDQGKAGKTYYMKNDQLWRFDEFRQGLDSGYPKSLAEVFPGIRTDPSGAFINTGGILHIVYGKKFYTIADDNSVSPKAKLLSKIYKLPGC